MTNRHYNKAPIIEAVIDIQVTLPPDFECSGLGPMADALSDKFPIRNNLTNFQFIAEVEKEVQSPKLSSTRADIGLRLSNSENSRILQLRNFGFAYSHLRPYSDWDCFRNEAIDYWNLFVKTCNPISISRCAVRYINRLDIPELTIEIEDYLNIYPTYPKGISQLISGMQMHLEMPQEDLECMAIINEATVDSESPNEVSVMLDIDVFKMVALDPIKDDVWKILEQLRVRKNELFEAFITDKTREIIK